jgi:hypothetical protein
MIVTKCRGSLKSILMIVTNYLILFRGYLLSVANIEIAELIDADNENSYSHMKLVLLPAISKCAKAHPL